MDSNLNLIRSRAVAKFVCRSFVFYWLFCIIRPVLLCFSVSYRENQFRIFSASRVLGTGLPFRLFCNSHFIVNRYYYFISRPVILCLLSSDCAIYFAPWVDKILKLFFNFRKDFNIAKFFLSLVCRRFYNIWKTKKRFKYSWIFLSLVFICKKFVLLTNINIKYLCAIILLYLCTYIERKNK